MNTSNPQLRYQLLTIVLTIGVFGLWLFNFLPFGTRDSLLTSETGQFVVKGDARLHLQNTDTGTHSNVFTIGDGLFSTAGNFDLSVSGSVLPPTLRYNGMKQVWQLSNDGSVFFDIVTESGGASLPLSGGVMTGSITFESGQDFANLIDLGDDTVGNYVATIKAGDGIKGSAFRQGATPTLSIDLLLSADGSGDTTSRSGLEFSGGSSNKLSLLQGCSNGQTLQWNDTSSLWTCANAGAGGTISVKEGATTYTGNDTLDFTAADFTISQLATTAAVAIDYASSKITRSDQAEAITGAWTFSPVIGSVSGGTGVNGSAAANGTLLIGNGSGYTLSTLTGSNGLDVGNASGAITLSLDVATSGTTATTSANSGLELTAGGLRLLGGCSNDEVLAWSSGTSAWTCAAAGGSGSSKFTDSGTITYLTSTTDDLAIGGTTGTNSRFFFDVTTGNQIVFEGTGADDAFETTLVITNPTADRTITIPDLTGTVILSGHTFTSDVTATLGSGGTTALTIASDAVALTTDTTGNYVATGASGSGVSLTGGGSEGATLTAALGALTADWNQTGAFNISLNNVSAGLKMLENGATPTLFGIFDVADLSSTDKTYTFPDASGTVLLSSTTLLTLAGTSGTPQTITNGDTLTIAAGSGITTTGGATDTVTIASTLGTSVDLTTEVTGTLPIANGGTGATTFTDLITLGTHTTGNYVATGASGNGVSLTGGGSEGATLTAALGALTADWNQTGAFNISLNNVDAGLKILENGATPTLFGIFDVADLSSTDKTYTFPDATITVNAAGDISGTTLASNVVTSSLTTVGTLGSLTVTGAIAANGGITFDAATDTLGAHRLAGTLDANTNILENIGNTGTDFIASTGGLTLAGILTANGGISLSSSQSLSAAALAYVDLGLITHSTTANQGLRLPNAASASPSSPTSGEGYLAWDAGSNQLIVYNGSAWATVGGGSVTWDAIGDAAGNGAITFNETVQTLDWNTADTAAAFDGLTITLTNDATTDTLTQRALVVANLNDALATGTTETIMQIDNRDINETVGSGLTIENTGAGTMTNALSILETAGTITTAISIGNNVGTGISIGTGVTTGISVGSGGITATGEILFTNTGAGVSLTVNDEASDATPFVVDAGGNVGIGTSSPARALDIVQAASAPQLRLSKDLTNYSEFTVDSTGDLLLGATGTDIRALSENLWICDNDACPALTLTGDGNIFVENVLKFGNGVYMKNDSATELGVYDNDDNAMLIFDEQ